MLAPLRECLRLWTELDEPLEAAQSRPALAQAPRGVSDLDAAVLGLQAARGALERLGACLALPQGDVRLAEIDAAQRPAPLARSSSPTGCSRLRSSRRSATRPGRTWCAGTI